MTRWTSLLSVGLLVAGGCGRPAGERFTFAADAGPQRVTFLTEQWTGGGGDPVLVGPTTPRTLVVDGLRVLVLADAARLIYARVGPQPAGTRTVLVEARVHLERASTTVTSNPPHEIEVYQVVVDDLIRAEWYAPGRRPEYPAPTVPTTPATGSAR